MGPRVDGARGQPGGLGPPLRPVHVGRLDRDRHAGHRLAAHRADQRLHVARPPSRRHPPRRPPPRRVAGPALGHHVRRPGRSEPRHPGRAHHPPDLPGARRRHLCDQGRRQPHPRHRPRPPRRRAGRRPPRRPPDRPPHHLGPAGPSRPPRRLHRALGGRHRPGRLVRCLPPATHNQRAVHHQAGRPGRAPGPGPGRPDGHQPVLHRRHRVPGRAGGHQLHPGAHGRPRRPGRGELALVDRGPHRQPGPGLPHRQGRADRRHPGGHPPHRGDGRQRDRLGPHGPAHRGGRRALPAGRGPPPLADHGQPHLPQPSLAHGAGRAAPGRADAGPGADARPVRRAPPGGHPRRLPGRAADGRRCRPTAGHRQRRRAGAPAGARGRDQP